MFEKQDSYDLTVWDSKDGTVKTHSFMMQPRVS